MGRQRVLAGIYAEETPALAAKRPEVARAEPCGSACIDVGGDRGALVLRSTRERSGLEVAIQPVGEPTNRTHVFVLARSTPSGVLHAALFPSLRVGRYEVLDEEGRPAGVVDVETGSVTTANWR